ncbi:MAG: ATP-binding protein [Treponema sp.]|nr:ATP-binding protein [Treponema sp.]
MRGIQYIEVSNRKAKYTFELKRNITMVCGDSGSGKTTLYRMVRAFYEQGSASGVKWTCSDGKKCAVLSDPNFWLQNLENIKDSIIFIDEGLKFILSEDFAKAIKGSDNYYVFFNRERLSQLPYSVDEIYQIKTSGKKNHFFVKLFDSTENHIYTKKSAGKKFAYDTVVVEDSKSGYEFYQAYFDGTKILCETAKSKSKLNKWVKDFTDSKPEKKLLVIADGAAFGSEVNRFMEIYKSVKNPANITLCLPESFEWLILKSGLLRQKDINEILENPSDYVESKEFFSWEQFFTHLLVERTKELVFMRYSENKSTLADFYKQKENAEKIIAEIKSGE